MPHLLTVWILAIFGFFTLLEAPVSAAGSSDGSSDAAATYPEAKALVDAGSYAVALPMLEQLTRAEPQNADAWNLLGFSHRKLGEFDAAGRAYEVALKLNPSHLGALEYQGEFFLQTGAVDQAKANLATLQRLCGDCEEYQDLSKALAAAGA